MNNWNPSKNVSFGNLISKYLETFVREFPLQSFALFHEKWLLRNYSSYNCNSLGLSHQRSKKYPQFLLGFKFISFIISFLFYLNKLFFALKFTNFSSHYSMCFVKCSHLFLRYEKKILKYNKRAKVSAFFFVESQLKRKVSILKVMSENMWCINLLQSRRCAECDKNRRNIRWNLAQSCNARCLKRNI